ncbi:La-related protein 6A [Zea mays]|uniref:La-related protein 6A n=1 Tax=Zea mays TaxID=4577 RepID=A0A1D6NB75_MAIZE|nr:La-related protein 6A [Zea mays]
MQSPTPPPPLLRSSRTATATRRDVSCQQRPPLNNVATSSWAKPPPSLLPVEMHNTARSIHLLQHPHPRSNGVAMSATNSAPSPLSNNVATSASSDMNDGKVVCVVGFAFLFAVDVWLFYSWKIYREEIEVAYNCRKGKYGVADEDIILYGQCV